MNEEMEMIELLLELVRTKQFVKLKETLNTMNPADIALFFSELKAEEVVIAFRITPKDLAADTFVEMAPEQQKHLIESFTDKELKALIDDMYLDDTVDVIEEMPANVVKRILTNSDPENRKLINELLEYPDDTAGSIMTPEFISLSSKMTVDSAFDKIRRTGINKESIYFMNGGVYERKV